LLPAWAPCRVALACALGLCAQSTITFQYFYDDLGQLIKVIDSSGNEIDYTYDAVGNILSITRTTAPAAGALAIFNFTPRQQEVAQGSLLKPCGFSTSFGRIRLQCRKEMELAASQVRPQAKNGTTAGLEERALRYGSVVCAWIC